MFLDGQEKKDCCGCMACSQVCNLSAIAMKQDENGFFYPEVDKSKCVDCGMCEKVCPMREDFVGQDANPETFAVRNKKEEVLNSSSSGGVVSMIGEWVLGQNGVVYGAAYDDAFQVRHLRAQTLEEAERFRTSKYVESDVSGIYETLIQDLKDGRVVLLTGTPCQISGWKKYLEVKRVDTTNLYTCDNICHGVPSRKLWEEYLSILKEKYIESDDHIVYVNMRSKKDSGKDKKLEVRLEKRDIESVVDGFSYNLIYQSMYGTRPSCFNCKYTSYKRPSDITVGDFWNAEKAGIPFEISGGISEVLINTDKGKALLHVIKEGADMAPISKENAWQLHLENPSKQPGKQDEFWQAFHESVDKEAVFRKYMKGSILTRIIRAATPILRKTGLYDLAGKAYKAVFVRK